MKSNNGKKRIVSIVLGIALLVLCPIMLFATDPASQYQIQLISPDTGIAEIWEVKPTGTTYTGTDHGDGTHARPFDKIGGQNKLFSLVGMTPANPSSPTAAELDQASYKLAVKNTANYIAYLIKKYQGASDYYLLGQKPSFHLTVPGSGDTKIPSGHLGVNQTDPTNYPEGRWKIIHDYNYFDNTMGECVGTNEYTPNLLKSSTASEAICEFDRTGRYDITYDDESLGVIYVHRKPNAEFNINIGPNVASVSTISFESVSYDLDKESIDHGEGLGKGISAEKYEYKKLIGDAWGAMETHSQRFWNGSSIENVPIDADKKLTKWDRGTTPDKEEIILVKHTVWDMQKGTDDETAGHYSGQDNYAVRYIGKGNPMASFDMNRNEVTNLIPLKAYSRAYDPSGLGIMAYNWEIKDGSSIIDSQYDIDINSDYTLDLSTGKSRMIKAGGGDWSTETPNANPTFDFSSGYVDGKTYTLYLTVFNQAYDTTNATDAPDKRKAGENASSTFSRQFTYYDQKLVINPNGGTITQPTANLVSSTPDVNGNYEMKINTATGSDIYPVTAPTSGTFGGAKFLGWRYSGNGSILNAAGKVVDTVTTGAEHYFYSIGTGIKDTIKAIFGIGYNLQLHYPQNGEEKVQEWGVVYNSHLNMPKVRVTPEDAPIYGWYYKVPGLDEEAYEDIDNHNAWIKITTTDDSDKLYNIEMNHDIDVYLLTEWKIIIHPSDLQEGEVKYIGTDRTTEHNKMYVTKVSGNLEVYIEDASGTKTTVIQTPAHGKVKGIYINGKKDNVYKIGEDVIIDFFPENNPDVSVFLVDFENVLFYIDYGYADGRLYKYSLNDLLATNSEGDYVLSTPSEAILSSINPKPGNWDNIWRWNKDSGVRVFDSVSTPSDLIIDGN